VDAFEAVRTILAVRSFDDKPVPDEVIRRVVEAGRLTGSSRNLQPWQFIVVQDRAILQRLGELATTGRYTAEAAFAILVLIEDTEFAVSDGSRAVQSMILTAWSEGIGSNWVGFSGRHQDIKDFLGVPANLDILAILPFGYPTNPGGRGIKKRKSLTEVAHRDRFGQAYG